MLPKTNEHRIRFLEFLGDPHNFGKRVARKTRKGQVWFVKPRTTYWEWLFFGQGSPIARALEEAGKSNSLTSASPFDFIFNLRISTFADGKSGESEAIFEVENSKRPSEFHCHQFGLLLSYCYALGIQDLHSDNLMVSSKGVQVIDAEVVLTRLALPNETLLLPLKRTGSDPSGLMRVYPNCLFPIPPRYARALIRGFVDGLRFIENSTEFLLQAFSQEAALVIDTPIRVILRDTRDYIRQTPNEWDQPSCREELIQLERGDVPYFFTTIRNKGLYYYTSPNGDFDRIDVPLHFQDAVNRAAVMPELLLSRERIRRELFPRGVLYLANKLSDETLSRIEFDGGLAYPKDNETWAIESDWGNFLSR